MRKRTIIVTLAVLVTLFGLVALVVRPRPEPEYGGKKLSEWVEENGKAGMERATARLAIRQIGKPAIPFLLKWMVYDQPTWQMRFYRAINSVAPRLTRSWFLTDAEQRVRRHGTWQAWAALGPQAEGAVPELTALMTSPMGQTSHIAAYALYHIGPAGVPALMSGLTNTQAAVRCLAAYTVAQMRTNASPAVPVLIACLRDRDEDAAATAASIMGRLQLQPEVSLRALAGALYDPRANVRREAAKALANYPSQALERFAFEEFGAQARKAAPPLRSMLADTNTELRQSVIKVLQHIDREGPEKARSAE